MATQQELQAAADLLKTSETTALQAVDPLFATLIAGLTTLQSGLAVTTPTTSAQNFLQRMINNLGSNRTELQSLLSAYGAPPE